MRHLPAVLALCLAADGALAADYPCSQVRLIVPYAAGGAIDVSARLVGERLGAALDRNVVIESKSGAAGNIGTAAVVNSPADGCTLLVNSSVMATFSYSFTKLGFDPLHDLTAVGGVGLSPTLIITATATPITDMEGLIETSKQKPGGLNFGTVGYGALGHLAVEEFAQRTGAKFAPVPYKGGAQALGDLVTGRLDFGSFPIGSVLPLIKEGKLKALAVVQEKRSALVPEIASTVEQGLPPLNAGVQIMIYAPAATPKTLVARLSSELAKITADPALQTAFAATGFDPTPMSAEEANALMRRTAEDWGPVIKRLNIKLD